MFDSVLLRLQCSIFNFWRERQLHRNEAEEGTHTTKEEGGGGKQHHWQGGGTKQTTPKKRRRKNAQHKKGKQRKTAPPPRTGEAAGKQHHPNHPPHYSSLVFDFAQTLSKSIPKGGNGSTTPRKRRKATPPKKKEGKATPPTQKKNDKTSNIEKEERDGRTPARKNEETATQPKKGKQHQTKQERKCNTNQSSTAKKGRGRNAAPPTMRRATCNFTCICFSLLKLWLNLTSFYLVTLFHVFWYQKYQKKVNGNTTPITTLKGKRHEKHRHPKRRGGGKQPLPWKRRRRKTTATQTEEENDHFAFICLTWLRCNLVQFVCTTHEGDIQVWQHQVKGKSTTPPRKSEDKATKNTSTQNFGKTPTPAPLTNSLIIFEKLFFLMGSHLQKKKTSTRMEIVTVRGGQWIFGVCGHGKMQESDGFCLMSTTWRRPLCGARWQSHGRRVLRPLTAANKGVRSVCKHQKDIHFLQLHLHPCQWLLMNWQQNTYHFVIENRNIPLWRTPVALANSKSTLSRASTSEGFPGYSHWHHQFFCLFRRMSCTKSNILSLHLEFAWQLVFGISLSMEMCTWTRTRRQLNWTLRLWNRTLELLVNRCVWCVSNYSWKPKRPTCMDTCWSGAKNEK